MFTGRERFRCRFLPAVTRVSDRVVGEDHDARCGLVSFLARASDTTVAGSGPSAASATAMLAAIITTSSSITLAEPQQQSCVRWFANAIAAVADGGEPAAPARHTAGGEWKSGDR